MFKSGELKLPTQRRKVAKDARQKNYFLNAFLALLCVLGGFALKSSYAQTQSFSNIGRTATPQEIKAWDIDVRPDFKGLPTGQGSVKQGEAV